MIQKLIYTFLTLLIGISLVGCKPFHFKIDGIPAGFKDGVVKRAFIEKQTLNLIVQNGDKEINIKISPWKEAFLKVIRENSTINVVSKISPSGISKVLELCKDSIPYLIIGNRVSENIEVMKGYKIRRGRKFLNVEGKRVFTDIILEGAFEKHRLSYNESYKTEIDGRKYTFILMGASVENPDKSINWVESEEANFIADYLIFIE